MSEEQIKIEILEWNAVAVWKWDHNIENCAICKMALSDKCPDCGDYTVKECLPVWGQCNHPYH
jgi:RING-box protein 1